MSVVVLGAGPAGLMAALRLARRELEVTVVERASRPGGLAAGTEVAGIPVDLGSHRLHPSIRPDLRTDLEALLGEPLQRRPRHGRLRLRGRWIDFPLVPTQVLRALGPRASLRLLAGLVAVPPVRRRAPRSFAEAVSSGLGRPLGEVFYFPYARKIWGLGPEELSAVHARQRIGAQHPGGLLLRVLRRHRRGFLYPRGGFGRIPAALAEGVVRAGADLRLDTEVTGLTHEHGRWQVHTTRGRLRADIVCSTIPITRLAQLLDPPAEVASAVAVLRYRAMVLCYLVVDRRPWTPYDAHYLPDPEVPTTRVSEPTNYRDDPDDPPDRTVVCVEVPTDADGPLWRADDATLLARARRELCAVGLPDPGERGVVRRIRHAYPIYRVGAEDALEAVERWLGGFEGLLTFGRQGLFAHDNTHHALAMGAAAAEAITTEGRIDAERWAAARASFRSHVVED